MYIIYVRIEIRPEETPMFATIDASSTEYPRPDNFVVEVSFVFKISTYLFTAPKLKKINVANVANQCDTGVFVASAPKNKRNIYKNANKIISIIINFFSLNEYISVAIVYITNIASSILLMDIVNRKATAKKTIITASNVKILISPAGIGRNFFL